MPRFVLLYHDCPPGYERASHWDLMLEFGEMLRTWAIPQLPSAWHVAHQITKTLFENCPALSVRNHVLAERLSDHRRDYLHLEGELSRNRGTVRRVAEGDFVVKWETQFGWYLTLSGSTIDGDIEFDLPTGRGQCWTITLKDR
jgi:DNA polymerase ligase (LigD)-like protein